MVITRSWQQFFTVPISKLSTEKIGNSATLPAQYSLAFERLVSFQSESQNTEKSEPCSVPNLFLTYQRNMLVIYIFFALAYPLKTNLNSENCIVHSIYYYYCIPSAGLTHTWIVETQNFCKRTDKDRT